MFLSDRKKKILQIVVDDYIASASPISSKQIYDKHMSDLSPATIRNELASLEEMEYLIQPYTSSGRIPSSRAYRLYVAELMQKEALTENELNYIAHYFDSQIIKIEDIVKSAAKLISDMTNYTAIASIPKQDNEVITEIKLIKISESSSLLVIVINNETVKDTLLTNAKEIDDVILDNATTILNNIFKGQDIRDLLVNEDIISQEFEQYRYLYKTIISVLKDYMKDSEKNQLVIEGQSKILQYPEFSDVEKAKQFFNVIDSKKYLMSMLDDSSDIEVIINIGAPEHGEGGESTPIPNDFSVVTAKFKCGDKELGSAGVIGPARMQYGKVISVLDNVGKILNDIIDSTTDAKEIKK